MSWPSELSISGGGRHGGLPLLEAPGVCGAERALSGLRVCCSRVSAVGKLLGSGKNALRNKINWAKTYTRTPAFKAIPPQVLACRRRRERQQQGCDRTSPMSSLLRHRNSISAVFEAGGNLCPQFKRFLKRATTGSCSRCRRQYPAFSSKPIVSRMQLLTTLFCLVL